MIFYSQQELKKPVLFLFTQEKPVSFN